MFRTRNSQKLRKSVRPDSRWGVEHTVVVGFDTFSGHSNALETEMNYLSKIRTRLSFVLYSNGGKSKAKRVLTFWNRSAVKILSQAGPDITSSYCSRTLHNNAAVVSIILPL